MGVDARVLSPGGRLFADANFGPKLWDVATGKALPQFPKNERYGFAAAFSNDGKKLAVAGFETRVLDVATGKSIAEVIDKDSRPIHAAVAFSPDGETLAVATQDSGLNAVFSWTTVVLADKTGKILRGVAAMKGHYSSVTFSPDGKTLAAGPGNADIDAPGFCLWDVATGKKMREVGGRQGAHGVVFSPDGQTAAGAAGQIVVLWDVATGKELRQLKGHRGNVTSLAFSQDGGRLASGSADTTVLIWSIEKNAANKER